MKFRVGEQVRVREDILIDRENPYGVVTSMVRLAGQVVTIDKARMSETGARELYRVKGNACNWSHDLFEKIIYTPDEAFKLYLSGTVSEEEYEEFLRRERG